MGNLPVPGTYFVPCQLMRQNVFYHSTALIRSTRNWTGKLPILLLLDHVF